jgi:S-adenosylmethionine synthetase
MAAEVFENQLLGYRAVLGGLEALTKDICVNCITLEAARTKVGKSLKKLAKDIEAEAIPCAETKGNLKAKVDAFSKAADELRIAEDTSCQKTAGVCKMGAACFATSAVDLLNLVPAPK